MSIKNKKRDKYKLDCRPDVKSNLLQQHEFLSELSYYSANFRYNFDIFRYDLDIILDIILTCLDII